MDDPFASLPRSLRRRARRVRLAGEIPALIAVPEQDMPAPACIWLHGRTVYKELDPGRYLRWLRSGIAACAIDLPAHGERLDAERQKPEHTLDVLAQTIREIDVVVDELRRGSAGEGIDADRLALGGMSAGGMAALRRLCDPHPFRCACVEGTTGWLTELYHPSLPDNPGTPWGVRHPRERIAPLDPMEHLATFRPIPLLVLHSEQDEVVPWATQRAFVERLREHYRSQGADPAMIDVHTWEQTGAPAEHAGFGRFAGEAKDLQTAFLRRWLIDEA